MNELNASLEREDARRRIAGELALEKYGSDDVDVIPGPDLPTIESVDGGFWVQARVFVDAEEVEDKLPR